MTPAVSNRWVGYDGPIRVALDTSRVPARGVLLHDFCARTASDERIVVPAGFETDFASIPRGLWNLLPTIGDYTPAAVVHDWLYSAEGRVLRSTGALHRLERVTRAEADAIFLFLMEKSGVPRWRRWLIYAAVRIFGRRRFGQ
jgi:hypothetical protein